MYIVVIRPLEVGLRAYKSSEIFLLLVFLLMLFDCSRVFSEERSIRFGSTANLGVLPLIAKNEGLFESNGLKVDYYKFQSGKVTMDALISGDIEVGTLVDSNISFINFTANPVRVIASLGVKHDHNLWFKKSSGILEPSQLKGKRIGYTPATTSHIFLARFLAAQKIEWSQIKPVILQPPAMESALRSGAVDAVSVWQPWGATIRGSLKEAVGTFAGEKGLYPCRILLATTTKVVENKPEQLKKVIKALYQAEEVYRSRADSTYGYLSQEIGTPRDQIADVLSGFRFSIEPGLAAGGVVLEIARWIMESQDNYKGEPLPDFSGVFDGQFLKSVPDLKSSAAPSSPKPFSIDRILNES